MMNPAHAGPGGPNTVVASFGERLKREREKRGMSLEDVSGATKISVRNLRALEQEKFDQMPGGIFNRGFVRSYAKHLGLDDEQVLADYLEAAGEAVPAANEPDSVAAAPEVSSPAGGSQSEAQVPWTALAGLLIFGTVLLAAWHFHSRHTPPERPLEASRMAQETPQGTSPAGASKPPSSVDSALNSAPSTPVSGVGSEGTRAAAPGASGGLAQAGVQVGVQAGFDISLRAHDEVWLSTAIDGQPPSESTLEDGQSVVVHAANRAILRVGNAAALEVAFNGERVPVHAVEGQVRTLTFTAAGLQAPAAGASAPN